MSPNWNILGAYIMCFIENLGIFSNNRPQTTNWKFNPYLTIISNIFNDKIENKKYNANEGKIVYKQKFKKKSFEAIPDSC